jgi:predicted acyl esterase
MPPGIYQVRVDENVMVAMRDGIKLSTDLYFPVGVEGKLPAILIRTPYNKARYFKNERSNPRQFAAHGFAIAVRQKSGNLSLVEQ